MNGLPYYKAYPRDFLEGTIGMDFELKGAYRLVLDLIYMQGGRLPDDARYIAGLLGCTVKKWKSLRDRLVSLGKIYVSGEFLANNRADNELETLVKLSEKQRENRARPNKNKELQSPRFNHTDTDTDTDTNKKKEGRKKDARDALEALDALCSVLSPDTAKAFTEHRRAKRAPLTASAARLIAKKLDGHPDPDAVANNSIMNGWTGVFPESFRPPQVAKRSTLEDTFARLKAEIDAGGTLN